MKGHGCNKCWPGRNLTTHQFVERAIKIHGNKYDYSETRYINGKTKVKIICPEHGAFEQAARAHASGYGCQKCKARDHTKTTHQFIECAIKIHGNKYDYSETRYINAKTKIKIICPEHGAFMQTPPHHQEGNGCPLCKHPVSKVETRWLDGLKVFRRQFRIKFKNGRHLKVDGFDRKTKTVYEFYGDFWHGNPRSFNKSDMNRTVKKTFGELYRNTVNRRRRLRRAGYRVIFIWESQFKEKHHDR